MLLWDFSSFSYKVEKFTEFMLKRLVPHLYISAGIPSTLEALPFENCLMALLTSMVEGFADRACTTSQLLQYQQMNLDLGPWRNILPSISRCGFCQSKKLLLEKIVDRPLEIQPKIPSKI